MACCGGRSEPLNYSNLGDGIPNEAVKLTYKPQTLPSVSPVALAFNELLLFVILLEYSFSF